MDKIIEEITATGSCIGFNRNIENLWENLDSQGEAPWKNDLQINVKYSFEEAWDKKKAKS